MRTKLVSLEDLSEIRQKIEQIRVLMPLFQTDEWKSFSGLLQQDLERKKDALCDRACSEEAAQILRAQIWYVKWLLGIDSIKQRELEDACARAKSLQVKAESLHNAGHDFADPEAKAVLAEAEQIKRQLQMVYP